MEKISSWGNYPQIEAEIFYPRNLVALQDYLNKPHTTIVRGQGRSYGDSALAANIISTKKLNYFLAFDPITGVLHCEAGVVLTTILEVFIPRGFFIPVTPGTKFVTVGGMIASDVHGKNHHLDGCFSKHLVFIELMLPNGEIIKCSKTQNSELFFATCGGMGLTGIIISARIRLIKINSSKIKQNTFRLLGLESTMELFLENNLVKYSVAWLDCFAKKSQLGRSLLMLGDHHNDNNLDYKISEPSHLPMKLASLLLNTYSMKIFNALYYLKQRHEVSESIVNLNEFFYPLDAINEWNKMYGSKGFVQYQFVLPLEASKKGLFEIL